MVRGTCQYLPLSVHSLFSEGSRRATDGSIQLGRCWTCCPPLPRVVRSPWPAGPLLRISLRRHRRGRPQPSDAVTACGPSETRAPAIAAAAPTAGSHETLNVWPMAELVMEATAPGQLYRCCTFFSSWVAPTRIQIPGARGKFPIQCKIATRCDAVSLIS